MTKGIQKNNRKSKFSLEKIKEFKIFVGGTLFFTAERGAKSAQTLKYIFYLKKC